MKTIENPQSGRKYWAIMQRDGQYAQECETFQVVEARLDHSRRIEMLMVMPFGKTRSILLRPKVRYNRVTFVSGEYEYLFVNSRPDLRYLRANVTCAQACYAAYVFAHAAALGGGEAPSYLVDDLRKVHVDAWAHIMDSIRRANKAAEKVADSGQNAFEMDDDIVRWRCALPQCGYNAPPTIIEAWPHEYQFTVAVTGRPQGVNKRLPHLQVGTAGVQELPMPQLDMAVA